jgi:ribonuclease Z
MTFEVTILGCGAATPTMRHLPTSQLVNVHDKLFLIDCGEGTQLQLRKYKIKFQRIEAVLISHLHGDHYLGLMGLISSMHLLGRKSKLYICGPTALKEIILMQMKLSEMYLSFDLEFISTQTHEGGNIMADNTLTIRPITLKHRIPCYGFVFTELEKKPKVSRNSIERWKLSIAEIVQLKNRIDIVRNDGSTLFWKDITEAPTKPRSFAFCSDTAFSETVIEEVKNVDLLYHEATFKKDLEKRAKETFHSTAEQAGLVAKQANVGQLMIGHFSSRYTDDNELLLEAQSVFPNTVLANEGLNVKVKSHL